MWLELEMKKDHRLVLELVVCSGGGGLEEEDAVLWAFGPVYRHYTVNACKMPQSDH